MLFLFFSGLEKNLKQCSKLSIKTNIGHILFGTAMSCLESSILIVMNIKANKVHSNPLTFFCSYNLRLGNQGLDVSHTALSE